MLAHEEDRKTVEYAPNEYACDVCATKPFNVELFPVLASNVSKKISTLPFGGYVENTKQEF